MDKYLRTNNGASINVAGISETEMVEIATSELFYPDLFYSTERVDLTTTYRNMPAGSLVHESYTLNDCPWTIDTTNGLQLTAKMPLQYLMTFTCIVTNTSGTETDYIYMRPAAPFEYWEAVPTKSGDPWTLQITGHAMGTIAANEIIRPSLRAYHGHLKTERSSLLIYAMPARRPYVLTNR